MSHCHTPQSRGHHILRVIGGTEIAGPRIHGSDPQLVVGHPVSTDDRQRWKILAQVPNIAEPRVFHVKNHHFRGMLADPVAQLRPGVRQEHGIKVRAKAYRLETWQPWDRLQEQRRWSP